VVLRQGDTSPAPFYLVAEGEVMVRVRTPAGRDDEVARLGPGGFFGEMAALTGDPRTATVAAARDSTLVAVDREAFSELFEQAPQLARALADVLAKRRQGLVKTIERAATGSERPPEEPHQLLDRLRGIFKNLA
jgi:CRP-like cAMP-binding protein